MSLQARAPIDQTIEQTVVEWIQQEENLVKAKNLDGGWEGWAQIQLALQMQMATQASISREQKIYAIDPNKRVDLFVAYTQGTNGPIYIGLELKCRTKGEKTAEFKERYLEDIVKINSVITTHCLMYAMAITDSEEDVHDWDKVNTKYTTRPQYFLHAGGWFVILWGKVFPSSSIMI